MSQLFAKAQILPAGGLRWCHEPALLQVSQLFASCPSKAAQTSDLHSFP